MKLKINESTDRIRVDLMSYPEVQEVDRILKAHNVGCVEVAQYTNEYTNLHGAIPTIYLDLDAFSYNNFACIDFDESDLQFMIVMRPRAYKSYLSPVDIEKFTDSLLSLRDCLAELQKIDLTALKNKLDRGNN